MILSIETLLTREFTPKMERRIICLIQVRLLARAIASAVCVYGCGLGCWTSPEGCLVIDVKYPELVAVVAY